MIIGQDQAGSINDETGAERHRTGNATFRVFMWRRGWSFFVVEFTAPVASAAISFEHVLEEASEKILGRSRDHLLTFHG